ncbi:MAG: hypothetical protein Q4C38_00070 [bacterium]|nr:hypothetical protein [bacterium]
MDSKKKLILGIILVLLVITITGTFAYLEWIKKVGRMVLTIGDISTTEVRISPYLISGSFSPRVTYEGEQYMEVRITNNENKSNKIAVYYEVKNIDSNLRNKYMKYTITKSESLNGTYTEYAEGDFSSVSSGDKLEILNESVPAGVNYYYKVYLWIDGSTGSQNDMIGKNIELETSTKIIKPITAETLTGKANPETLLYADATDEQKKEMWTFSHEATEQVGATTDYRYIGSSSNNYITFNNETWRIIGVFDGRIKIIRQDSLGKMPWDYKQSGVGSSTSSDGSNDWSDSQLMYMLNSNWLTTGSDILKSGYTFDGTYVKDGNGKIIYQKGCKPAQANGTTYSCTSNAWSLNDQALMQIDRVTYYLGGTSLVKYSGVSSYTFERGTTVYTNSPTNWSGYVGLAYPSDYIYTFANGVDETCFNTGNKCNTLDGAVPTSSWMKVMYGSSINQWLVSSASWIAVFGFYVDSTGNVFSNGVSDSYGVRPTVYLSSGIKLEGEGTSSNPYQILGD